MPGDRKREALTNVSKPQNPTTAGVEGGVQGGTEITPKETPAMVEEKVQDGMSKKQARKEVAKETGLKENSIKVAHQRAEKKKRPEPEAPIISDVKMSPSFADAYDAFIKEVAKAIQQVNYPQPGQLNAGIFHNR